MSTKICKACLVEKDIEAFSKHSTYKDGRDAACKDCRKNGKLIRGKGTAVTVAEPQKKRTRATPLAPASWSRPAGFGFNVCREVDAKTKQTDIRLEQTTGELGEQTIWLNQAEARELQSWLTEQLGDV